MRILPILWITVCLAGFAFHACVEKIDLTGRDNQRLVSINGHISNQPGPYRVTVRKSAIDITGELAVSGAQVQVLSQNGQLVSFPEISPGIYQSDSSKFVGRVRQVYQLQVFMPDGALYQSREEAFASSSAT